MRSKSTVSTSAGFPISLKAFLNSDLGATSTSNWSAARRRAKATRRSGVHPGELGAGDTLEPLKPSLNRGVGGIGGTADTADAGAGEGLERVKRGAGGGDTAGGATAGGGDRGSKTIDISRY